jgi:hypothetical protein
MASEDDAAPDPTSTRNTKFHNKSETYCAVIKWSFGDRSLEEFFVWRLVVRRMFGVPIFTIQYFVWELVFYTTL